MFIARTTTLYSVHGQGSNVELASVIGVLTSTSSLKFYCKNCNSIFCTRLREEFRGVRSSLPRPRVTSWYTARSAMSTGCNLPLVWAALLWRGLVYWVVLHLCFVGRDGCEEGTTQSEGRKSKCVCACPLHSLDQNIIFTIYYKVGGKCVCFSPCLKMVAGSQSVSLF